MTTYVASACLAGVGSDEITAALQVATARAISGTLGRDLEVRAVPELRGAEIGRCCAEVFVGINPEKTAIVLECWHDMLSDPYKILWVDSLDEAVRLALAELDCE